MGQWSCHLFLWRRLSTQKESMLSEHKIKRRYVKEGMNCRLKQFLTVRFTLDNANWFLAGLVGGPN